MAITKERERVAEDIVRKLRNRAGVAERLKCLKLRDIFLVLDLVEESREELGRIGARESKETGLEYTEAQKRAIERCPTEGCD